MLKASLCPAFSHTGILGQVSFPEGVRADTWVETGVEVSPHYDSLLAKLMVHGTSRVDAIAKLQTALDATQVGIWARNGPLEGRCLLASLLLCSCGLCGLQITASRSLRPGPDSPLKLSPHAPCAVLAVQLKGVTTNLEFLRLISASPALAEGRTTTKFVEGVDYAPHASELPLALRGVSLISASCADKSACLCRRMVAVLCWLGVRRLTDEAASATFLIYCSAQDLALVPAELVLFSVMQSRCWSRAC